MTMRTMPPHHLQDKKYACEDPPFVRVGGRYRVGKLLGSGGSGEWNS